MDTNKLIGDGFKGNFMLVTLAMSVYAGRKADNAASKVVSSNAGAMEGSARVTKNSWMGADVELKAAKAAYAAVRAYVYEATTPWSSNTVGAQRGPRLLATQKSIEFMKKYNGLHQLAKAAVKEFENVFDARKASAIANLGTLGHADEYPDVSDITKMFHLQLDFDTVPDSANFDQTLLPPQVAQYLVNKMEQRQTTAVNNAVENVRQRILSELSRVTEQMTKLAAGEKTRMYGSLITNMESLVELMGSLNVQNDPDVEALIKRIKKRLCAHTIDQIKNSGVIPKAMAVDAADLAVALEELELY